MRHAIPIVGTQDDDASYGATFDALNIWDLRVKWRSTPIASLDLATQLPVASFDSIFPCAPTSRDCLPSRVSRTRISISISCPTASGRLSGWPTGTSRPMSRW